MHYSRRHILKSTGLVPLAIAGGPAFATPSPLSIPSLLQTRALASLARHANEILYHDVVGIADFSRPSSAQRFHLLDLASGRFTSHFVAHGFGSDPEHTGWLKSFSNMPSSRATSAGAFRTNAIYSGKHGRSIRLDGLDATNSNALARAIVVHMAHYVSEDILNKTGVLGRSDGCFAVSANSISEILAKLGPGRMIYADSLG